VAPPSASKEHALPDFAIVARDAPGTAPLRASTRPRHLDYLRAAGAALVLAGPLLDEDGAAVGSLLIVRVDDLAAAQAFAAADPYAQAGLFAEVRIDAWRQVFPEGG
jgi:uncharacterized protein YciI